MNLTSWKIEADSWCWDCKGMRERLFFKIASESALKMRHDMLAWSRSRIPRFSIIFFVFRKGDWPRSEGYYVMHDTKLILNKSLICKLHTSISWPWLSYNMISGKIRNNISFQMYSGSTFMLWFAFVHDGRQ